MHSCPLQKPLSILHIAPACKAYQQMLTWLPCMPAAKNQEDGRSRGFAHIQFDSVEAAAKAIALNGSDLLGRALFIDSAQERAAGGGAAAAGGGRPSFGGSSYGGTPGRGKQLAYTPCSRSAHGCTGPDAVHVWTRNLQHRAAVLCQACHASSLIWRSIAGMHVLVHDAQALHELSPALHGHASALCTCTFFAYRPCRCSLPSCQPSSASCFCCHASFCLPAGVSEPGLRVQMLLGVEMTAMLPQCL